MSFEADVKSLRTEKRVKWGKKMWSVPNLLLHMDQEIKRLKKNQCKVNAGCIFKYHDYLDKVYGNPGD
jgi:hypothetical protein